MKSSDFLDSDVRRFWSKVLINDLSSCWEWQASKTKTGYGYFGISRSNKTSILLAHRVSFAIHNGEIPDGMYVCHHCDNPSCCNPSHLFSGTQKQNLQDAARKGRMNRLLSNESIEIVKSLRKDGMILREIAERFGVSISVIYDVVGPKPNQTIAPP